MATNNERTITLDAITRTGFGFGHILNDLCASLWFSYSLLFYKLSYGDNAYTFVVIGQAMDAVTTTGTSFLFDSKCVNNRFFALGKYKTWYIIGTALFVLSFPVCMSEVALVIPDRTRVFLIYLVSILVSQAGWSFVQISHLSLINEISIHSADRIWLTSVRQAASIYCSIVVFLIFWYTLSKTETKHLSPRDIYIFSNNSFYITVLGLLHSVIFLITVKEKQLVQRKERCLQAENISKVFEPNESNTRRLRKMDSYGRLDWLKDSTFYKISFIYMISRLYLNLPTTYIPLYLQETLFLTKSSIAFIPLIIYVSGLLASFLANFIENNFGNKFHLFVGVIFGLVASFWTSLGNCNNEEFKRWQIYAIAVLIGIATTIVKISSISLVADMIGRNLSSISFVYGTVSCFEKVLGGVTIGVLEQFNQQRSLLDETLLIANVTDAVTNSTVNHVCSNGFKPILFYYYIISYGNAFILFLLMGGLFLILPLELNKID